MEASSTPEAKPARRRLVMCFDGTGNKFQADDSDTNIVKIYKMLDRTCQHQFHYYQPGIGTYNANREPAIVGPIHRAKEWIRAKLDQGFAISFEDHIAAGYRFLMRYYEDNDEIYIFGFSRGAYTARFLAEMIKCIGLLSMGNEEMVYFAWKTFSDYQRARVDTEDLALKERYMHQFKDTFCRQNVCVHFLGLFDCVNSVKQFDLPFTQRTYRNIPSRPANHIRHAVSIHERRVKFKPALFRMTKAAKFDESLKEVWFAGNHGDVGGGWGKAGQSHMYSDTPLRWMVEQMTTVANENGKIALKSDPVDAIQETEATWSESLSSGHEKNVEGPKYHDHLTPGRGAPAWKTALWWILEVLPFSRLELKDGKWVPQSFPPNFGSRRDMPAGAVVDTSVDEMHVAGILDGDQMPKGQRNSTQSSNEVSHEPLKL